MAPGAQLVVQTGLASGMSAVSGLNYTSKPNKVDPSFDGLSHVLPQSLVPTPNSRLILKATQGDVQVPYIFIGAWP